MFFKQRRIEFLHFAVLHRTTKEMYKELQRTCTAVVLLIESLFSDVTVPFAVVVLLSSLLSL